MTNASPVAPDFGDISLSDAPWDAIKELSSDREPFDMIYPSGEFSLGVRLESILGSMGVWGYFTQSAPILDSNQNLFFEPSEYQEYSEVDVEKLLLEYLSSSVGPATLNSSSPLDIPPSRQDIYSSEIPTSVNSSLSVPNPTLVSMMGQFDHSPVRKIYH